MDPVLNSPELTYLKARGAKELSGVDAEHKQLILENALLTEKHAQKILPMSLPWYRKKRSEGGGPPFEVA